MFGRKEMQVGIKLMNQYGRTRKEMKKIRILLNTDFQMKIILHK